MGERTCSELMSCVKGILKDPSGLKNLWKDLSSCDRRPLHSLRKRWVKLMWVPQPGSVAVSTSAPQKMDQILGLSQIVYHSSPTGCLQVGVELRDKDVPWTLVLVSSLYLKKSCYKNGERQNQCLIFSPLFVNWPNKSWRPSNLPKTVTDESFLSIIMNSWLFVRLIVATVANFLTLSLSEAGLLLGLQPLLRWLWVDEGWGSPRCQQCSNKQEGGEGGEGGVRKLQGESVSRRTDWPAVSCCW